MEKAKIPTMERKADTMADFRTKPRGQRRLVTMIVAVFTDAGLYINYTN